MKNPSGRPIISGNESITEKLSRYIRLHPYVANLLSYIHDTMHLLQNIDGLCISPTSALVAIDVEALYSSIPHDKGLACIKHIISQNSRFEKKTNDFLLSALEFILQHNDFTLNGSHFLQVQGVAMGTLCAPLYGNLYLGEWECMIGQSE